MVGDEAERWGRRQAGGRGNVNIAPTFQVQRPEGLQYQGGEWRAEVVGPVA